MSNPIKRQLKAEDYAISKEWIDPEIKQFVKTHKKQVIGIPLGILAAILLIFGWSQFKAHQRDNRLSAQYDVLVQKYGTFQDEIQFDYVPDVNKYPKDSVTVELVDQQLRDLDALRQETIQTMDVSNPTEYSKRLEVTMNRMQSELDNIRLKLLAKSALNELFESPAIKDGVVEEAPVLRRDLTIEDINEVNNLIQEPTDDFWIKTGDLHTFAKSQQAIIASAKSFIDTMFDGTGQLTREASFDALMQNVTRIDQLADPQLKQELYLGMEPAITVMLDQAVSRMYLSGNGTVDLKTTTEDLDRALELVGVLKNFIVQKRYLDKLQPVTVALRDEEAKKRVEEAYQAAIEAENDRNGVTAPSEDYYLDWYNSRYDEGTAPSAPEEGDLEWSPAGD